MKQNEQEYYKIYQALSKLEEKCTKINEEKKLVDNQYQRQLEEN